MSVEMILLHFPYVFKNEFNERKILHHMVDTTWGKEVVSHFMASPFANTIWGVQRQRQIEGLTRTLVITEDKYGKHQLFQFWYDFARNMNCYCEIKKEKAFSLMPEVIDESKFLKTA